MDGRAALVVSTTSCTASSGTATCRWQGTRFPCSNRPCCSASAIRTSCRRAWATTGPSFNDALKVLRDTTLPIAEEIPVARAEGEEGRRCHALLLLLPRRVGARRPTHADRRCRQERGRARPSRTSTLVRLLPRAALKQLDAGPLADASRPSAMPSTSRCPPSSIPPCPGSITSSSSPTSRSRPRSTPPTSEGPRRPAYLRSVLTQHRPTSKATVTVTHGEWVIKA